MKKVTFFCIAFGSLALMAAAQTAAPTPTEIQRLQAEEERLKAELRVLEAEVRLMNTLRASAGSSNITAATSGGSTTFSVGQQPNLETVSLSYEAVREIADMIDRELKPSVGQYRSLVIYHEPDFLALARYRLYREQVRMALANFEEIKRRIGAESVAETRTKSLGVTGAGMLLGAPGVATAAIKSVAELASLFRTDQVITQSKDVIDKESLNTVVAGTFLKANPGLVIYHPEQFVPEYDIGISDERSLYSMVSRLNAAEAYLDNFLDEVEKLPAAERDSPPLSRIIAAAKIVRKQIADLDLTFPSTRVPSENAAATATRLSEFRQMMRAEKLERALNREGNAKAGVLKIRLLSSGGARREKRNLLLGARTDYSGSAVVEVALYDADGTMRVNEVFSYHTGFRKFKTDKKPRL